MNSAFLGRIWLAGLAIAMGVAACGGKVFVDLPGQAGGGGNGGGPTGGGLVSDCNILCATLGQCGSGDPNCVQSCQESAAQLGPCMDEYIGYLDCLAANIASIQNCSPPPDLCQAEITVFANCQGGSSVGGAGGGLSD